MGGTGNASDFDLVRFERRGPVAWIIIANPPVNALIQPVRAGIDACLARAIADPEIGAVVIAGAGRTFPVGTDVREATRAADQPSLGALCTRIEDAPKPVIAAIHGTALGGGLELALACHIRLARAGAQLGLPDVMLGLVPNAGATQRLPRLVGAGPALEMLLRGLPLKAKPAAKAGLIDRMIRNDFDAAVGATAANIARSRDAPRPTRARTSGLGDPKTFLDTIAARRAGLADDRRAAAHRLVDLVEAALLLPFEAGLAMEHAAYHDLVDGPQARALRHIFLAERRAGRNLGAAAAPGALAQVALLGHGDRAAGVARACLAGGLPVFAVDGDEANRLALRARVVTGLAADVRAGRIRAADQDAMLDRFDLTGDLESCGAALVIVAAEAGEARRAALARAGAAWPGAVVAIAEEAGDRADFARVEGRGGDMFAYHLPSPARRTRLIELAIPPGAAPELSATAAAFARVISRYPLTVQGTGAGLVTATLDGALFAAAEALVLAGLDFAAVDAALTEAGFEAGPFERADRGWSDNALPPDGSSLLRERIAGASSRGRFYLGSAVPGARGEAAPEARALVAELRRAAGQGEGAPMPDASEIVLRCILALANAGARLLARGVVRGAAEIDLACVHGLGMTRLLGGPMQAADQTGLLHARTLMRGWAAESPRACAVWDPAPLFDDLIRDGRQFCGRAE